MRDESAMDPTPAENDLRKWRLVCRCAHRSLASSCMEIDWLLMLVQGSFFGQEGIQVHDGIRGHGEGRFPGQ